MDEEQKLDEKARRELLLKVYDAAINEYRFNVNLGWDRTKFFLLLNSGLVVAGIGLLKVAEGSVITSGFLVAFFFLCIFVSRAGLNAITIAKGYYRESVYVKTVVERELGLLGQLPGLPEHHANLSIAVTDGQRETDRILSRTSNPEPGSPLRNLLKANSATDTARGVFITMKLIEIAGAMAAVVNMIRAALS